MDVRNRVRTGVGAARSVLLAFAAALLLALPMPIAVGAQELPNGRPRELARDRPALEREFRERLGRVVRDRLGLNDEQMRDLELANRKFETQRRSTLMREREIRTALRTELGAEDRANQERVGQLLDDMLRLQRQRLALHEDEQRELARFLTPVQRAKYFGLQEQMRRRMEDMRSQKETGMREGPPRRMRRPAGGPPGLTR